MSPEQLAAIKAVSDILTSLGSMPLTSIAVLVLFGPWVVMIMVSLQQNRRFEAVATMYADNVQLVKDYQDLVRGYKAIVSGQQDLIIHTTQVLTGVKSVAENNLYCPMVRKETKGKPEVHG
ncbi:MAG: hypothetical protein SCI25_00180 [Desulfuromonadales bacterium]|nr:hypothetical protein [Desulfuromonadales bacterium]